MLFFVKLAIVPLLVVTVSAVGRRLGPRAAGLLVGLPLATAPVVFFLTLSHGPGFGLPLVQGVLRGLIATEAFAVFYAAAARGRGFGSSLLIGLTGFAVVAAGMSALSSRLTGGWLIFTAGCVVAMALGMVRHFANGARTPSPGLGVPAPFGWRTEMAWRAGLATAMFATITLVADHAGPSVGGLLAPFPVVTAVMAVFTQRGQGARDTLALLAGMVRGTFSFWAFFAALALTLPALGIVLGTCIACGVALAWQGLLEPVLKAGRSDGDAAGANRPGPEHLTPAR